MEVVMSNEQKLHKLIKPDSFNPVDFVLISLPHCEFYGRLLYSNDRYTASIGYANPSENAMGQHVRVAFKLVDVIIVNVEGRKVVLL
jgi:hypothetical protein